MALSVEIRDEYLQSETERERERERERRLKGWLRGRERETNLRP